MIVEVGDDEAREMAEGISSEMRIIVEKNNLTGAVIIGIRDNIEKGARQFVHVPSESGNIFSDYFTINLSASIRDLLQSGVICPGCGRIHDADDKSSLH